MEGPADSAWYVGIRYDFSYINAVGTPYYFDQSRLPGSIIFNFSEHTGDKFLYDLVRDQLVLLSYLETGLEYIVLNREWVHRADLSYNGAMHRLITDQYPRVRSFALDEGYYELIYQGEELMLLARHMKRLEFRADQSDHNVYAYTRRLWLIRDNQIHDVTRENRLLKLFPEDKRAIRAFRKGLGEKYDDCKSQQLRNVASFCEEQLKGKDEVVP